MTSAVLSPSLRERQKQRRKKRIYTVAIQMFRERGFTQTTATDIARHAHVSRGTFFNYYPYKEAVLLDYGAEVMNELRELTRSILDKGTPAMQALEQVMNELVAITMRERDLIPPLVYELINPDPERSRTAYQALPLSKTFEMILREIGNLRDDHSVDRIAASFSDAYLMTALRWSAYQPEKSLRDELRRSISLVLEGALAR